MKMRGVAPRGPDLYPGTGGARGARRNERVVERVTKTVASDVNAKPGSLAAAPAASDAGAGPTLEGRAGELDRDALADLLEAVAEHKDKLAFTRLFDHFAPRVKGYLIRLGSDAAQAEELAQDVMLTVWRKAAMFDRRQASVSTWLFTVARNRRIDMLRREKRPELDPTDPLLVPDPEQAPDDAVETAQREDQLRAAIKDLPEEQAELLRLAFFKGKSHREIAEESGVPLGTVKSRLRLAFTRLRKVLDDADAAPE